MKKLLFLTVCAAGLMTACTDGGKKSDALKAQNDSLLLELVNRDAEMDGIMSTFNEIQDGFREINVAENRVDLKGSNLENQSATENIKQNIRFISDKLQENREKIAKLESMLQNSNVKSSQMQKAIKNLVSQLEEKQKDIEVLQAELAAKNIRIAELDDAVMNLNKNVSDLAAENEAKAQTVSAQDQALNTAWYVFGTKRELRDQKILAGGDVLKSQDFNKDYFTTIDIRETKEIRLYSKHAELLTTHPKGSYELRADDKKQLTLVITNAKEFWSVSRYLVIQVK